MVVILGDQTQVKQFVKIPLRGLQQIIFDRDVSFLNQFVVKGTLFAEGSTIEVQENVFLEYNLYDKSLVDVDLTWFGNKTYIGNYRYYNNLIGNARSSLTEGFITSDYWRITERQRFLVVPSATDKEHFLGTSSIDNCNFTLLPRALIAGTPPLPQAGFIPGKDSGVFRSQGGIKYYDLSNIPFEPKIDVVQLYITPGVELFRATRITSIVGLVAGNRSVQGEFPKCNLTPSPCEGAQAVFRAANPNLFYTRDAAVAFYTKTATDPKTLPPLLASITSNDTVLFPGCSITTWAPALQQG